MADEINQASLDAAVKQVIDKLEELAVPAEDLKQVQSALDAISSKVDTVSNYAANTAQQITAIQSKLSKLAVPESSDQSSTKIIKYCSIAAAGFSAIAAIILIAYIF